MVAGAMRCLYVDLDGTLLGPGGSLLAGADGRFSALGVRALEACARAGIEVVLYSGRKESSVFEAARMIGSRAYIFEIGCGLVIDGELEWLTDGIVPSESRGSIHAQIEASGAPALLLEVLAGRLEYHTPWSIGREVSHLFRGDVDLEEVRLLLDHAGSGWLRLVDNGIVREHSEQMPGLPVSTPITSFPPAPRRPARSPATCRRAATRGMSASRSGTRARMPRPRLSSARSGSWQTHWSETQRSSSNSSVAPACGWRARATAPASTRRS